MEMTTNIDINIKLDDKVYSDMQEAAAIKGLSQADFVAAAVGAYACEVLQEKRDKEAADAAWAELESGS